MLFVMKEPFVVHYEAVVSKKVRLDERQLFDGF